MRKIALFAALALFSFYAKAAEISYVLPDIVAPDMNVYLEIVAPTDDYGSFGSDGFYANNPGDVVRVECLNAADTNKITFGPIVVSWEGRLISTQVFAHPYATPNSWDWENLSNEWRIPIRVFAGSYSAADTIYVVRPFHMGDISGNGERVLGAGSLGKRSRRGAMIVDSVSFANAEYTVSKDDCDPYDDGNQGYLPFVLLAYKDVYGGLSTINGGGETLHGGPGGGGGGGKFCDGSLFNQLSGDDGGDGFTGGGPGGRNCSGCPDRYESTGTGTGVSGESLNGVLPPQEAWYEASGGGTGHPFGLSGLGCNDGAGCDPLGKYGGGSGGNQNKGGGCAGYTTDGSNTRTSNGGKAHGNEQVVPIAGGSGGASGNPQAAHQCSGNGGGGGGAVVLGARRVENIRIYVDGGDGSGGVNGSAGGAGSGGYAGVFSKLTTNVAGLRADGGAGGQSGSGSGGAGRLRTDCKEVLTMLPAPPAASYFVGPTTDTNKTVERLFTLNGSKQNGGDLRLFLKPENGLWSEVSGYSDNGATWSVDLNLPGKDSIYFFAALQEVPSPSTVQYEYEPSYVLSQAAANIFDVPKYPIIDGDSVLTFDVLNCEGASDLDTAIIRNLGDANLELYLQNATFAVGGQGFELVSPTNLTNVDPEDSVDVIVRFNYQTGQTGTIRDTLIFDHNDVRSDRKPWTIYLEATIEEIDYAFYDDVVAAEIDTLDFGSVCLGNDSTMNFRIQNYSDIEINLKPLSLADATHFSVNLLDPSAIAALSSARGEAIFSPQSEGDFSTIVVATIDECPDFADTLVLIGKGIETALSLTGDGDFGLVRAGETVTRDYELRNEGSGAARIETIPALSSPWSIVNVAPPVPTTLAPGESITVTVEYAPTDERADTTYLAAASIEIDASCRDSVDIMLFGEGKRPELIVRPDPLDFGTIASCETIIDTVYVENIGEIYANITSPARIAGSDAAYFSVIDEPSAPYRIDPGESRAYAIEFDPNNSAPGVKTATIEIDTDEPAYNPLTGELNGENKNDSLDYVNPINVGSAPVGDTRNVPWQIDNVGDLEVKIMRIDSDNPDVSVAPQSATIPVGGSSNFTVTVDYTQPGDITATLSVIVSEPCPDTLYVDVIAKGLSGELSYSNALDFGLIATCEEKIDSIYVENVGEASVDITSMSIQGADAILFNFTEPMNFPYELAPGEIVYRKIKFSPDPSPDGPKEAEILVETTDINDGRFTIPLSGENEGFNVRFVDIDNGTDIDFGLGFFGESKDSVVTATNFGKLFASLIEVYTDNPSIAAEPDTASFNPDASNDFLISISYDQIGQITGTIYFVFDRPCPDTLELNVVAEGAPSVITQTPRLDYGILAPCEDSTMTITIENTGAADAEVREMKIEGPDAALFSYSDGKTLPATIPGGATYERSVTFAPEPSADGVKNAKVVSTIFVNDRESEFETDLAGERRSGLLAKPSEIDFGSVVINLTKDESLRIENIDVIDIEIVEILPLNLPNIFQTNPTTLSRTLAPGEFVDLDVTFSPLAETAYEDTLRLAIKVGECDSEIMIFLRGEGAPAQDVRLWLPNDIYVSPALDDYAIPIYGQILAGPKIGGGSNKISELSDLSLRAVLSFDAGLFVPAGINPGTLRTLEIDGRNRIVEIEIDDVELTDSRSTIAEIRGATALGDTSQTDIAWEEIEWTNGSELIGATNRDNGFMQVLICNEGGKRLLNSGDPASVAMIPDPANSDAIIRATALEVGEHTIRLIDARGKVLAVRKWNVNLKDNRIYEFPIDLGDLSSGIYFLVLQSPNRTTTERATIIK